MKNKIISNVLYGIIIVFFIIFGILAIMGKTFALYASVGMVIHYVLSTIFHELGHLIVGKARKMVFAHGRIFFLEFYKKKQKTKLKFSIDDVAGETTMVSTIEENAKKDLIITSISGILVTIAYILVNVIFGVVVGTKFSLWFFTFSSIIPLYMLIINLLPLREDSDGAIFFGLILNSKKYSLLPKIAKIQSILYNGKTLSTFGEGYFNGQGFGQDNLNYYKIKYYQEIKDYQNSYELCKKEINNSLYIEVLPELVFNSSMIGEKMQTEYDELISYDLNKSSYFRAKSIFNANMGDFNFANVCLTTANALLNEEFLKGLSIIDKSLIEEIKAKIKP